MIRVLVVDDDFMVAKVHSSVVARQPGFQVVGVVHSAAAALEAARTLRPDLVLLDVYLPDMSGLDVLRRLRERAGGPVDVIVISAARDVESIRKALHGGVFQYLVKPFEIETLRQRLVEFADHRAELGELDETAQMRQDDVDRAFRAASGQQRRLPKSISPETTEVVERALADADRDGLSAMECAEATGLSRSSTRRYLDHLVDTGAAELLPPRYGAAGRPERRYRTRTR